MENPYQSPTASRDADQGARQDRLDRDDSFGRFCGWLVVSLPFATLGILHLIAFVQGSGGYDLSWTTLYYGFMMALSGAAVIGAAYVVLLSPARAASSRAASREFGDAGRPSRRPRKRSG